MRAGLVSVTFRQKSVPEVLALAKEANLETVEWGGDVHVPAGDTARAAEVGRLTRDAGLCTGSYGSYFRCEDDRDDAFLPTAQTAHALGAQTVRIWAGSRDAQALSAAGFDTLVHRIRAAAAVAAAYGQTLAFEFHHGTANNTARNALRLHEAVGMENVRTYWQPTYWADADDAADLAALRPILQNVHVYHWKGAERFLLSAGQDQWKTYVSLLADMPCDLLLEFVRGDCPDALLADAQTLRALLFSVGEPQKGQA